MTHGAATAVDAGEVLRVFLGSWDMFPSYPSPACCTSPQAPALSLLQETTSPPQPAPLSPAVHSVRGDAPESRAFPCPHTHLQVLLFCIKVLWPLPSPPDPSGALTPLCPLLADGSLGRVTSQPVWDASVCLLAGPWQKPGRQEALRLLCCSTCHRSVCLLACQLVTV